MMLNTPKNFTIAIENIAKEKKITHMEAVLWYCEQEGIEPDTDPLVTGNIICSNNQQTVFEKFSNIIRSLA